MEDNNKILSLIIPTYNMEKYLRKCLDSLNMGNEKMGDLEVLIINDGSKDSSLKIAHEYETKCPQTFRVIDKENGNYGSCVNRGLNEASGKYIKVLDADDSFNTEALSAFIDFLSCHDADLFITNFQQVHDDGEVVSSNICPFPSNHKLQLLDYFSTDYFKFLQMHSVTYRRQNLIDIHYKQTEGISYTDAQWIFLPISTVKSFYYCPYMLYNYLIGREGQTMAADVFVKSIPQLIKMTIGRVNMFEQYHLSDSAYRQYFLSKLSETLKFIYRYALVVDVKFIEELKSFDDGIKNSSQAYYEYSNDVVLFDKIPFKLIKRWRESGRKQLPILNRLFFKILYRLSDKKR